MNPSLKKIDPEQKKMIMKNRIILLILFVVLLTSFVVSMNTGYTKMSPLDTLRTLFGGGTDNENIVLFDFRLPRIVISMLIGAGLALSGCIIQGVARNPLADPGLLGINAGAGLMVVLYVLLFDAKSFLSIFSLPFIALIGAGITAIIIYMLAYKRTEGVAPIRLVLIGVAIQAGISAAMILLVVKLDENQFMFIATWQAGSIWGSNWKYVLALVPWLCFLIPYALIKSRVLDVLNFGDEMAAGLGADVEKERRRLLSVAVALAAASVAVSGSISFVGLLAPHLARQLVGPRHRVLLPACALVGAVLVSVSDTLARVLLQPAEIPTGIVVAVVGAPYFLYLLAKSKN